MIYLLLFSRRIDLVLTIQEKVCVGAPQFVQCNAGVVAVITLRHIEERQLGQRSSVRNIQTVEVIEDSVK